MNVAVIGAGPAGMTAAYQLTKHLSRNRPGEGDSPIFPRRPGKNGTVPDGSTVDVYEAAGSVGGLARSLKLWGQTVDLGPHRFFSRDRAVNELWLEVVGRDYAMVSRLTRILYRGRFFKYPLQPFDTLLQLGPMEALRCAASYAREKLLSSTNGDSFESWVTARFGRRLFEVFFKSYSEKLWGIPCGELDADFAAQRIKNFSLSEAAKAALSSKRSQEHATLLEQFAYPLEGTGMVYSRMQRAVEERGGRVLLNSPIERVLTKGGRVVGIEVAGGEIRKYEAVISSMPLTTLVARLADVPDSVREQAAKLTFRNTILIYLEVASDSVCGDHWIYIHDPHLRTGRITNFRNWVPQLCGDRPNTILAMEYWCDPDDEIWRASDESLMRLAKQELVGTSLVDNGSLITNSAVYRIPKCYPVYRRGYRQILDPIQDYLKALKGLQVIGRYGAFKYNNQDHSILMGMRAAENVLGDTAHDLWGINCDYETYQEASRITDAGLVAVH